MSPLEKALHELLTLCTSILNDLIDIIKGANQ